MSTESYFYLSVCWFGLRRPIASSLFGGGIPAQNSGYVGH